MEDGQAIVCLVGDNIRYTPGVAMRVFGALDKINIRMISQGASLLNLSWWWPKRICARRWRRCTKSSSRTWTRRSSNAA